MQESRAELTEGMIVRRRALSRGARGGTPRKKCTAIVIAGLIALSGGNAMAGADDVMSKLKALEGEWTLLDENGADTGVVAAVFKPTANGSAVSEVMMPGGDHEMLNVYHADGDRVLMTHYCAAGNQPRLEISSAGQDRLELRFESITNLASDDATHMHQAEYRFEGADHLTTYWYSMQDGKLTEEPTVIDLARKPD